MANFGLGKMSASRWDPTDIASWKPKQLENNSYNNMKILDGIYQSTEKKIDRILKQQRLMALQKKQTKKTFTQERIE